MPEGRPVLLTVDDDVSVSRSVARDLRRRYGEHYRVVRAEDPVQALDALREVKLRGDPVAAILADYRMPGLNGIEFLLAVKNYPIEFLAFPVLVWAACRFGPRETATATFLLPRDVGRISISGSV